MPGAAHGPGWAIWRALRGSPSSRRRQSDEDRLESSLHRLTASACFLNLDCVLLVDDWLPCPPQENDCLPATRLSASEMSYFSSLVISDMVMAKPRAVQHTLRVALITQSTALVSRAKFLLGQIVEPGLKVRSSEHQGCACP